MYNHYYESNRVRRWTPPARYADAETVEAFKAKHPEECDWIERSKHRFDFAGSLAGALNRYGNLTENQLAAVRRCIEKDRAFAADRARREANAPMCSVTALETAFATAHANSIGTPKLYFAEFRFSPAPSTGINAGAIYVKDRDGNYLGKIANGRFVRARNVDGNTEEDILAVCADPYNQAIAYGKRFGRCACCNRTLSDPESVARGIGPVCAAHYGWENL
jgi:hypothetical protein